MLSDEQIDVLQSAQSSSDDTIVLGGSTVEVDLGNMAAAQSVYSYPSISSLGNTGLGTITINGLDLNSGSGSSYSFSPCYTTSNWNNCYPSVCIDSNGVNIKEGGDIKIGEKSLAEAIAKIEERLAILKPNPEMEDKWEELKQLGQRYRDLEKELYEKEKMWDILKRE